jgi:hypothetical protein
LIGKSRALRSSIPEHFAVFLSCVCGVLCIFCAGIGAAIDQHWHDTVPFVQAKIEDTKPLFFPTETLTAPRQQHRPRQRKELKFWAIG